ncbi:MULTISPECIES: RelA/SpoT domain-containing protein [Shewanella]|uniref:RelA/SpoT domain-containing protein n=1 Tax=Shewanella algae TaxID=38313 RepID=UPI001AACBB46|nr:RelA/SpoT domain-containing protein [Shewanella algae]MBO2566732.1 RelA/SpoT domain-containing protein [Shewanella algae]QTE90226.1 RelA/SpoT domain-containing protein [Shewanella algae]
MDKVPSGKKVLRAGEHLIDDSTYLPGGESKLDEAFKVLSYWRFSYEKPLENALVKIKSEVNKIDPSAIFAKRLKRFPSIVLKLRRFPKMNLKNMQDIGGCRVILANEKRVNQVSRSLRKMPEFRWDDGFKIKNYIEYPKPDGYRSFHIVGKFKDQDGNDKRIEVQLRTRIQHYWATALEIIDLFTKQSLKTNQGEELWKEFFFNVSQQFQIMDNIPIFDKLSEKDKKIQYLSRLLKDNDSASSVLTVCDTARELGVISKLKAFARSLKVIGDELETIGNDRYVLLEIDVVKSSVAYTLFDNSESEDAQNKYTELEKKFSDRRTNIVVALVYANAVGGIKEAYPNFFADSTRFSEHLSLITEAESLFRRNFLRKVLDKANLAGLYSTE